MKISMNAPKSPKVFRPWKPIFLFFLLLICLIIHAEWIALENDPTKLVNDYGLLVNQKEVDLGKIPQNQNREHKFILTNISAATIRIQRVEATCGCTGVKTSSTVLNPKESTDLTVEFDTANRLGNTESVIHIAWTYEASKFQGRTKLSIKACSVSPIHVDSSSVDFGYAEIGKGPVQKVVKIERGEDPQRWDNLTFSTTNSSISLKPRRSSDDTYELLLSLNTNTLPIGLVKDEILVLARDKMNKVIGKAFLHISAKVTGNITASPTSLYFGTITTGMLYKKTFFITSKFPNITLEVLDINLSDSKTFKVAIIGSKDGKLFFSCEAKSSRKGPIFETLRLKIRDSSINDIMVPLIAVAQ